MEVKVYTILPTPFRMGGVETFISTLISEYERMGIGCGYYGILFQNPHTKQWHMALEECGALIGTNKSKAKLIKQIKEDVSTGDPKIMESQIKLGKQQLDRSEFMPKEEWFSKFRKEKDAK